MAAEFDISLVGASAPDGEISLSDLAEIARTMQDLTLKIGRMLTDQDGPGRTRRAVEELAQLRLRSIASGSTRLSFAQGPADALDIEHSELTQLRERLWEVFESIGQDRRPDWVSDAIARSTAGVVDAFKKLAPTVELSRGHQASVRIDTSAIHRDVWMTERRKAGDDRVVAGYLEKVDLHDHNFRIRDAVGNAIKLESVRDAEEAARLVGTQVAANGPAIVDRSGSLIALGDAVIRRDDSPARFSSDVSVSLAEILESAPGPSAEGAIDLTDEEFEAFLEAVNS